MEDLKPTICPSYPTETIHAYLLARQFPSARMWLSAHAFGRLDPGDEVDRPRIGRRFLYAGKALINRPIVQDRVSFNFVGQPGRINEPAGCENRHAV